MTDRLSLVDTWLAVATMDGRSPIAQAVRELNADLGTRYRPERVWEWRSGRRSIPQPVQDYMLRVGIERAVRTEGGVLPLDDGAVDRIAQRLCPPPRE